MNCLLLDTLMLAAAAYEERKQILHLRFRKTGDVYRYFEFQAAHYQAFLYAESRGRFFLTQIRGRFPFEPMAKLHAA